MSSSSDDIGLNSQDLVLRLVQVLQSRNVRATEPQLKKLIDVAFFASLEREEGRPVTFAVALVGHDMLSESGTNRKEWSPIPFSEPQQFSVATIAKLAPAVDHRQTLLAVAERDGHLAIVGLVRTNTLQHRFAHGEASHARGHGFMPVIIRARDAGVLVIDVGSYRFGTFTKGEFFAGGRPAFQAGLLFEVLDRFAHESELNLGIYIRLITRIVLKLVDRGHGGILVILTDNDEENLRIQYRAQNTSPAIREAILFSSGDRLGATCDSYHYAVGCEPDSREIEINQSREQAVEEDAFEDDVASFAADLASVDGALIMQKDLGVVGFGAQILYENPESVPCQRALDAYATELEESPLPGLGTRHNSTARLCYNRPGAIGIVVSQDGAVSCMLRRDDNLIVWRPVELEHTWSAHLN